MEPVRFFVAGTPIPKGSAKAFVNKFTGRAQVMQDNREKQKPWASMIGVVAQGAHQGPVLSGPVSLSLQFVMPRLKGHYGSGKNANVLKPSAPHWHVSRPDLDKLVRCVKDALTGVVWQDDSQVCEMGDVSKMYGDRPGVHVTVRPIVSRQEGR